MNNEVYGPTTGQVSPTSELGMKTKTSPHGNLEGRLNPLALALASGCGYVARGFSGQPKHLAALYAEGIRYPGFALIDVFSPCVTFNKQNTYDWFRKRVYKLEDARHDPTDVHAAMDAALEWGEKIPIGLMYRNPSPRPSPRRRGSWTSGGCPAPSGVASEPDRTAKTDRGIHAGPCRRSTRGAHSETSGR
jgi:2-oxoglutarate/2-oxoacid ferredoxin oxidoreductase subunit beta